jgi:hypothetical protein
MANYFPHKGTVKDHLVKIGVLMPRDHMRTDRRCRDTCPMRVAVIGRWG